MQLTELGVIALPLILLCMGSAERLLKLLLVGVVFDAAAVVTLNAQPTPLGLGPALVVAALLVLVMGLRFLAGERYPAGMRVVAALAPLHLFAIYALLSAGFVPTLLQEQIYVWPQKLDPAAPGAVLLAPSAGNVTQSCYILLNVLVATCAAMFACRNGPAASRVARVYLHTGFLAVGFCVWQLLHIRLGAYFPESVLFSNPGWNLMPDQVFGAVPRITGSFAEPSFLALFMCGITYAGAWLKLRGHRGRWITLLLVLSIATLLLSTSTTGIVAGLLGLPLLLLAAAVIGRSPGLPRMAAALLVVVVALPPAGAVLSRMAPEVLSDVETVMAATSNKTRSESYDARSSMDQASLALLVDTYGLGAGWGSNRSSSLLPGLAASTGVVGLVLTLWFVGAMVRLCGQARQQARTLEDLFVIDALAAGLAGHLAAAMISAPTLSSPGFFAILGLLVGHAVRLRRAPAGACAALGSAVAG